MRLHDSFEWDENKARKNFRKHGISFEDAARVLSDEDGDFYHVEEYDDDASDDEDRYMTTASHPDDRGIVLRIAWTDRSTGGYRITRIISCRASTRAEKASYVKETGKQ